MVEALTIFAVIWIWCGLLLGLGAAVEWVGGIGRRRKQGVVSAPPEAPAPTKEP